MTTQPPPGQCQYGYKFPQAGYCGQKPVAGDPDGYCILHSQDLQKDRDAFKRAAEVKIAMLEDYNFKGCVAPDGVALDFSEKEFTGLERVDFRGVQFHGDARADFNGVQFHGDARADFNGAQFHGDARADFRGSQFHDLASAYFENAQFHDRASAYFENAQFHDQARAYFNGAQFHGDASADFFVAQFHDRARADFRGAQFHDRAMVYFSGARFHDRASADFWKAEFRGEAGVHFREAEFHGEAEAYFGLAQFDEGALANFSLASLQHLDFLGKTMEGEGFFRGRGAFTEASFGQRTVFESCQFAPGSTFEGADLEKVAFRGCNLAGVSFRDATHLAEAEFENIDWKPPQTPEASAPKGLWQWFTRKWEWFWDGKVFGGLDRPVIWDEREGKKNVSYAVAEHVYRGLKQSYERRGDYPRGGEFYYGEMEMRRMALPEGVQRDFFSGVALYRQLSGYGLQWHKAGFWFLVVWLLFAGFHSWFGFQVAQPISESTRVLFVAPEPGAVFSWEAVGHALLFSLGAMLLRPSDIYTTTSGIGPFLVLLQGVLGPLLLGLMALAIRRKVHR